MDGPSQGYYQPPKRESQPGLEPVGPYFQYDKQVFTPANDPRSYKETASPQSVTSQGTWPTTQYSSAQQNGGYDDGKIVVGTSQAEKKRERIWIIGGAVLIAVIAGIIGGVVGWKVTEGKNGGSSSSSSSNGNNTAVGSPNSNTDSIAGASRMIRPNAPLAVTGWRYGTDFALRLFYQGPDDVVRYSQYDTLYSNWSVPRQLGIDASSNSTLAAAIIWWLPDVVTLNPYAQTQFFYRGTSGKIEGQNWRDSGPASGFEDSVVNSSFTLPATSRITTYWPSVLYQDDDSSIQEIYFNLSNGGYQKPTTLPISGTPADGTPLIALPLTPSHNDRELRLLYRRSDGKIYAFNRNAGGTTMTSSGALPFSVPAGAGITAFATANSDDVLTTYLLWQDTSSDGGKVQIARQNSSSDAWDGPVTDPVFDGADNPTQLACVTAGSSGGAATVPLQPKQDMNRCFFQVGGALKEAWYDGDQWNDMGFVKMP